MMVPEKKDGNDNDKGRGALGPPLTFDCLLNCLDGVERADGIFTVITTNDLSKIDPALGLPRQLPTARRSSSARAPGASTRPWN